ncbi:hypothetical protein ACI65C_005205 [Semiaphis heraclei]
MISAQSVLDITEVIEVLKPLEAATRELCGEFYVTSSVIIPMAHLLYNKINLTKTTTIISSKLKVALLEQCQKRFEFIESVTHVAIATILDPRFKKIYFKLSIALSRALSVISDTLKTSTDQTESIPEPDLTDQEQNTSDGFSLWDNHNGLMQQTNQECIETEIGYPSELCLYLKSNLANLSEKPLEFLQIIFSFVITYQYSVPNADDPSISYQSNHGCRLNFNL